MAAKNDVRCTLNHDPQQDFWGGTKSGTLTLEEDSYGLKFRCELDGISAMARDAYAMIKRGDISDCSFAFTVEQQDQEWAQITDERGNRCMQRTLRNVDPVRCFCCDLPGLPNRHRRFGAFLRLRGQDYRHRMEDRADPEALCNRQRLRRCGTFQSCAEAWAWKSKK